MQVPRTTRWRHLLTLAAALVAVVGLATTGRAQNYPTQTVKIVVPFTAGGGVDVVARIVAPKLGEALGQSVIIENRGGAGGMLGAASVAQAAPDGYTLLFGTGSTHGTNSSVYAKLNYDPVRDFVPVALVTSSPLVLVVNPSLPVKTVSDFVVYAKSKPGELSFGSYGTGSINHLGAELFDLMTGIQANHIPYRGSAPMLTDLIGGRIHHAFDGVSTSLGYVNAGTVRLLGVAGTARSPIFPDAPTVAETVPGFDTMVWFGLFAPAGTPRPVVDLLNRKVNDTLAVPEVRKSLEKLGIDAVGGAPDALAAKVQTEIRKWANIVRQKNIHVEP